MFWWQSVPVCVHAWMCVRVCVYHVTCGSLCERCVYGCLGVNSLVFFWWCTCVGNVSPTLSPSVLQLCSRYVRFGCGCSGVCACFVSVCASVSSVVCVCVVCQGRGAPTVSFACAWVYNHGCERDGMLCGCGSMLVCVPVCTVFNICSCTVHCKHCRCNGRNRTGVGEAARVAAAAAAVAATAEVAAADTTPATAAATTSAAAAWVP